jgi:hypothetical protein
MGEPSGHTRTRYPTQVSVSGTRTDDGEDCTLLAVYEATGTWMIHSLNSGAVRLTENEAARLAIGILHLMKHPALKPHHEHAHGPASSSAPDTTE